MNETISGTLEQHTFQTETRQLLDIVSHSLYTDKEVFLRELLSNASDALEKIRYQLNKNDDKITSKIINREQPLEIHVFTDKDQGQIIITDNGIGMTSQELIDNLGTIARSGSKAFVKSLAEQNSASPNAHIIGQFGVGFYSVFMVADKVDVYSKSAYGGKGYYWTSDGSGSYSIAEADHVERGTKIVIHLKENVKQEFGDRFRVENTVKKYSSYLAFPIKINGSVISGTGAIWTKNPNDVTPQQYKEFYQIIANRYDEPYYTYHSHLDAPKFHAQALIFIPPEHEEKFSAGRLKSGINLYCKKVLVKKNAPEIIPDWLRFVKGVVDSENIPIHISRENMQDSALIEQLRDTLMMKIIDFLTRQSQKDPEKYNKFYDEYQGFIKEGVCTDYKNRSRIAKLLKYETNLRNAGEKITLDEYIESINKTKIISSNDNSNNNTTQNEIFYLLAPNRTSALNSPYMEAFQDNKTEVLLCYSQIDEFCMKNLGSYKNKEIKGIETSTAVKTEINKDISLGEEQINKLSKWLIKTFPKELDKVESTYRLKSHPAVLVDHQSQAIRHYLQALGEKMNTPPQRMQINPSHNIIKGLYKYMEENEDQAKLIARQLVNNAYIAAGILDDPREMLKDMNYVMELAMGYTPSPLLKIETAADMIKNKTQQLKDNITNTTTTTTTTTTNENSENKSKKFNEPLQ